MKNYPNWAPKSLVDLLLKRQDQEKRVLDFDIEAQAQKLLKELTLEDTELERLRTQLWRSQIFLPAKESDALIEKLITSPQMKSVWSALEKRTKTGDRYAIGLWQVCDSTICRWRGESKLSPNARRELLQKTIKCVEELSSLLHQSREFDNYFIFDMVKDQQVEWLMEVLDGGAIYEEDYENLSYAKFSLSEIFPSIHSVLLDLQIKATEHLKDGPIVRKPQSRNAEVHYFVRTLSAYFQRVYGQPLHDSVATTTCTVFDRDDIDADYVRKLVSEQPGG